MLHATESGSFKMAATKPKVHVPYLLYDIEAKSQILYPCIRGRPTEWAILHKIRYAKFIFTQVVVNQK